MNIDDIHNLVYTYPSKHKEGLTDQEVLDIYSKISNFSVLLKKSKYISFDTCLIKDNGDIVNYRHDIYKKIIFALKLTEETFYDFD